MGLKMRGKMWITGHLLRLRMPCYRITVAGKQRSKAEKSCKRLQEHDVFSVRARDARDVAG